MNHGPGTHRATPDGTPHVHRGASNGHSPPHAAHHVHHGPSAHSRRTNSCCAPVHGVTIPAADMYPVIGTTRASPSSRRASR